MSTLKTNMASVWIKFLIEATDVLVYPLAKIVNLFVKTICISRRM